nr:methyltransferase domain-containing protein [Jiangella alkaliphila]
MRNSSFVCLDLVELPAEPLLDAVFAFDVIHDQADPATVLRRAHDSLRPDGVFVMMDAKAASNLEDNVGNPFAPLLNSISTLHCMTVSLAQGGAGLGTVWASRPRAACSQTPDSPAVEIRDVPDAPLDSVYPAHRAAV